jgi:hypothetical protein
MRELKKLSSLLFGSFHHISAFAVLVACKPAYTH